MHLYSLRSPQGFDSCSLTRSVMIRVTSLLFSLTAKCTISPKLFQTYSTDLRFILGSRYSFRGQEVTKLTSERISLIVLAC